MAILFRHEGDIVGFGLAWDDGRPLAGELIPHASPTDGFGFVTFLLAASAGPATGADADDGVGTRPSTRRHWCEIRGLALEEWEIGGNRC